MEKTTVAEKKPSKNLVAARAAGVRVHAAIRGGQQTLCGHDVESVGTSRGSGVDCRLCQKIAGDVRIVLHPRRQ